MSVKRNSIKTTMKELTRAEEQIMQVLWDLGKGFVKDIIDKLPEPKRLQHSLYHRSDFAG